MSATFPTVLVQAAFDSLPTAADPVWEDITDFVRKLKSSGPSRQRELDEFQKGTLDVLLDNSDGRFDPNNPDSPYWPNVLPMNRIRVAGGYVAEVERDNPNAYYRCGDRAPIANTYFGPVRDERGKSPGLANQAGFGATGAIPLNDALGFSAANNDRVDIADTGYIRFTNDFTIEALVNKTTSADGGVFWKGSGGASESYSLFFVGNQPHFKIYEAGGTPHDLFGGAVTPGTYSHIVGTYAESGGGVMRLFIDGVQVASATVGSFTVRNGFAGAMMGTLNGVGGFWLDAWLDEVALYGYALPADRVAAHHDSFVSGLGGGYLFTGYVEDWPQTMNYPFDGAVQLKAQDAFFALDSIPLEGTPFDLEVAADEPVAWWPLSDSTSGEGLMVDVAGTFDGDYEGKPPAGDTLVPFVAGASSMASTYFPHQEASRGVYASTSGGPITGYPFTVEFVVQPDAAVDNNVYRRILEVADLASPFAGFRIDILDDAGSGGYQPGFAGSIGLQAVSPGQTSIHYARTNLCDGYAHHVVITAASPGGFEIFVDGVLNNWITSSATPAWPTAPTRLIIGNRRQMDSVPLGLGGSLANVIFYDYVLDAGRINFHAYAFHTGWKSDPTGLRVHRLFAAADWPEDLRVVDLGQSTVQAQSSALSASALGAIKQIVDTETGALFAMPDGRVRFRDRHALLMAPYTTSRATFSDQAAGVNYDEIEPDFAVDSIKNDARVARAGGLVQRVFDATSIGKFFRRRYSKTGLLFERDGEARDHGAWVIGRSKDPPFRFRKITLTPYGVETEIFPLILGLAIGDRVTVEQQPPGSAAPNSRDEHIEGITHYISELEWVCELQGGLVDDTEYFTLGTSELGSAHVLGY